MKSDSEIQHEVTCETCLVRNKWSNLESAELEYKLHEGHRGSSLVPIQGVLA